jgi:enamine deaminase RidA (YjgF/YER057c/UK114 family)
VNDTNDDRRPGRFRSASAYEGLFGFSRAVRRGSRIVVSGTAPLGPDGETVAGDAYDQAKRCFETMVVVKGLLDPRWKVEIEAEAEVLCDS